MLDYAIGCDFVVNQFVDFRHIASCSSPVPMLQVSFEYLAAHIKTVNIQYAQRRVKQATSCREIGA
jgi:hypothetical protein